MNGLVCIIHKKLQISFITMFISEILYTKFKISFNVLKLTANFSCGLRCLENVLLTIKFLGE